MLRGIAGEARRYGDRLSLKLEVFATARVAGLLARNPSDDWRAVYHNQFIDLWSHLSDYSVATLREFRNRFRPLAHKEPLLPETQFLYRMLKAHIADRIEQENARQRDVVLNHIRLLSFGLPLGWLALTVIPLSGSDSAFTAVEKLGETVPERKEDFIEQLPMRCACPPSARGLVVLRRGNLHALEWYQSPASATVHWFEPILSALDCGIPAEILSEVSEEVDPPKHIQGQILDALAAAECSLSGTVDCDGHSRIGISASGLSGFASIRDGHLSRLSLHAGGFEEDDE